MIIDARHISRILGLLVCAFAAWHLVSSFISRNDIHPYTAAGWLNEQYGICALYALTGACLWLSAGRLNISAGALGVALLSASGLYWVSTTIFIRYFWASAALFSLTGIFAVAMLSMQTPMMPAAIRYMITGSSVLLFLATLAFVGASFLHVGN